MEYSILKFEKKTVLEHRGQTPSILSLSTV